MTENAYNVVRYPTRPRHTSLPTIMAAHAHLRGRPFVPFSKSRVLEIGCGEGGNILSLAAMAPDGEFVGFDLAEDPIRDGIALAEAAGLTNVMLKAGDILDPDVVSGPFDYVIAHGMYAWIPGPVREGMLALIGRVLSEQGLAFMSYNVAPGANIRLVLRSILLSELEGIEEPARKFAKLRETVEFYAGVWQGGDHYRQALAELAKHMQRRLPESIFHDELTPAYEPQRFDATVAAARRHGLDYLGDSEGSLSEKLFFPPPDVEWTADAWIRFEQVNDLVTQRPFRESVFCRPGTMPRPALNAELLRPLYAQGSFKRREARTDGVAEFELADGGTVEIGSASMGALIERIGRAYPQSVPLADVDEDCAGGVMRLFCSDELSLYTESFRLTLEPAPLPRASQLARQEAIRGQPFVSSLMHGGNTAGSPERRHLIGLLDGTRSRAELAEDMARHKGSSIEMAAAEVSRLLGEIAEMGILIPHRP